MTKKVTEKMLDDYMAKCVDMIAEHGWMVQGVFGTEGEPLSFSYTVGLTAHDKPELFLDTLGPNQAQPLLNAVAKLVLADALDPRLGGTFDADYSCPFKWRGPIDADEAEVNMARNLFGYDGEVTVWQVLWPDADGLFPDEDGYDHEGFPQRLITLVP